MGITAVFGFYDCQRWDYNRKRGRSSKTALPKGMHMPVAAALTIYHAFDFRITRLRDPAYHTGLL